MLKIALPLFHITSQNVKWVCGQPGAQLDRQLDLYWGERPNFLFFSSFFPFFLLFFLLFSLFFFKTSQASSMENLPMEATSLCYLPQKTWATSFVFCKRRQFFVLIPAPNLRKEIEMMGQAYFAQNLRGFLTRAQAPQLVFPHNQPPGDDRRRRRCLRSAMAPPPPLPFEIGRYCCGGLRGRPLCCAMSPQAPLDA